MPVVHVTFGTTDLDRGARFYDAVMAEYGGARSFGHDKAIGWSFPEGGASIGITYPFDGQAANVGNGTMFAVMAKDRIRCAASTPPHWPTAGPAKARRACATTASTPLTTATPTATR